MASPSQRSWDKSVRGKGQSNHQAICATEPATVNKAAAGNDAAFAFKTGFSARALIGLLGNDNFSFKVSPNGSTFFDAILVDRTNGQVELPQPTVLPGLNAAPTPPPTGKTSVYARNRAGAPWIDVMRPSGRDFPLQPHFGVNRIANWSPSITTTITTEGLPITNVGTVSHPTLAATNLAASMRRWRLTSAVVVDSLLLDATDGHGAAVPAGKAADTAIDLDNGNFWVSSVYPKEYSPKSSFLNLKRFPVSAVVALICHTG